MRVVTWSIIAFQLLWLNVFVPGHVRGAVTLGGGCDDGATIHCGKRDACPKKSVPTGEDRQRCAVCYVVAGYTSPPPVTFVAPPVALAEIVAIPGVDQVSSGEFLPTYWATAPPLA